MSFRLHNIDPIGLAMDWLETCKRSRPSISPSYSETAVFECECERSGKLVGRDRIMEYWEPRFALPPLRPFKLEQIWPDTSGVALVYPYMGQSPVRISFRFDVAGKIERSHCRPEPSLPLATAFRLDPWPSGAPHTPTGKRQRT